LQAIYLLVKSWAGQHLRLKITPRTMCWKICAKSMMVKNKPAVGVPAAEVVFK